MNIPKLPRELTREQFLKKVSTYFNRKLQASDGPGGHGGLEITDHKGIFGKVGQVVYVGLPTDIVHEVVLGKIINKLAREFEVEEKAIRLVLFGSKTEQRVINRMIRQGKWPPEEYRKKWPDLHECTQSPNPWGGFYDLLQKVNRYIRYLDRVESVSRAGS